MDESSLRSQDVADLYLRHARSPQRDQSGGHGAPEVRAAAHTAVRSHTHTGLKHTQSSAFVL